MSNLLRYGRVVSAQFRIDVMAALAYRIGFWSDGLLGIAWSLLGVVPLWIALEHRPDVAGWSGDSLMLLTGFYVVLSGTFGALIQPPLMSAMAHVRMGTLDYILLRPLDPMFSCLVCSFSVWRTLEIAAGIALIGAGSWRLGLAPSLDSIAAAALVAVSGLVTLYALGIFALSLTFRALQLENLTFLMESALDFARWPIDVFRGPLRTVFTFLIPFAFMTSYPAKALLAGIEPEVVGAAGGTAFVFAVCARFTWNRALRQYTSASS